MAKKKYIESPEKMWELFKAYAEDTKSRPILKHDIRGKDNEDVRVELERPLTVEGFENYVADQDLNQDLGDYFSNKNGKYTEYSTICSRIRKAIRQDQIEGGMAGIYNPSITQRLNGLVDKREETVKVEQPLFPDVSEDDRS